MASFIFGIFFIWIARQKKILVVKNLFGENYREGLSKLKLHLSIFIFLLLAQKSTDFLPVGETGVGRSR